MTDVLDNKTQMDILVPHTNFDNLRALMKASADLCQKKDAEYGESWCKRGGVGAFFTVWRKADRLETQLKNVGYNIFDLTVKESQTESIDETLLDLANYIYLVMEKRAAIRSIQNDISDRAHKSGIDLDDENPLVMPKGKPFVAIIDGGNIEKTLASVPGPEYVNQDRKA